MERKGKEWKEGGRFCSFRWDDKQSIPLSELELERVWGGFKRDEEGRVIFITMAAKTQRGQGGGKQAKWDAAINASDDLASILPPETHTHTRTRTHTHTHSDGDIPHGCWGTAEIHFDIFL